ncbi:TonB-dependent receptor plug domain-containing protein [Sphingobium nicotianae]|nr:TonB-dependent receptor [Sphingobium nicotianae]
MLAAAPAYAAQDEDLTDLSLEQLMNVEVTSVSKRPERLGQAAAAIFVISQDDIRRSGATNLPDILRMAPGIEVAQADATHWAVSIRGNNDIYSSKLLVLVDGRSIYSQNFAGVFWNVQDMPLQDIARIEVIRGSGGALWGANAVNGVINIITRSPEDTQGWMASLVGGTRSADVALRYGGTLSATASYRIWLKASSHGDSVTTTGDEAGDAARQIRAGFDVNWQPSVADELRVQGEIYSERNDARVTLPILGAPPSASAIVERFSGGHALANWRHDLSAGSDITVQAFFDRAYTGELLGGMRSDTYDIEARHHFTLGGHHEIVWGAGYRYVKFFQSPSPYLSLVTPRTSIRTANIFAQDTITLSPKLQLIAGLKLEHTSSTGLEYEPTLRAVWSPRPGNTIWIAASRAVRVPSLRERLTRLDLAATPDNPPVLIQAIGNLDQRSEQAIAFEAGYRTTITPDLNLDLAAYYTIYDDLGTSTTRAPQFVLTPSPPHLLLTVDLNNLARGRTYGGEISAHWQVTPAWRLSANYDLMIAHVTPARPDVTPLADNTPGNSPRSQIQIRSRLDLRRNVELDLALRRISALSAVDTGGTPSTIPAYTQLDARLGWRVADRLDIALIGQSLLDARHREYGPSIYRLPSEILRSVRLSLSAAF